VLALKILLLFKLLSHFTHQVALKTPTTVTPKKTFVIYECRFITISIFSPYASMLFFLVHKIKGEITEPHIHVSFVLQTMMIATQQQM
jgi:hypothetical protein